MTTPILARKFTTWTRWVREVIGWLGLAATPTFALMAWISSNDAQQIMICSHTPGVIPVGGMAWMYLLMSIFHVPPWLRLVSDRSRLSSNP